MRIERLFRIVHLLMNGRCSSAGELAEQCGVSSRTIYRDLDALSLAGIPVHSSRGYGGGVGLLRGFTIDKALLTEPEKAGVLHGLQTLEGAGYPDARNALRKLAALFSPQNDQPWLRVDFSSWCESGFGKDKFELLKEAILSRKVISFTYFNSELRSSERTAEPLCLLFRERTWYLWAWDRAARAELTFRVSRMRDLYAMGETFEQAARQEPEALPDYGRTRDLEKIVLKIEAAQAHRVFDEFADYRVEVLEDKSFIVREDFPLNEWLFGVLLSFGESLEVLEPQTLRRRLREKIKKMSEKYDRQ